MLIHPYQDTLGVHEGTRLLETTLGIEGATFVDPRIPERAWAVHSLFAPVPSRMLGGVRARLIDAYGFITFVNQRDLEVLLGLGTPGQICPWLGSRYLEVGARDWCGLFVDSEDLRDDLQTREIELRLQSLQQGRGQRLPAGTELRRWVHRDDGDDVEETFSLLWDHGYSDLDGLGERWSRIAIRRIGWPPSS